MVPAERLELPTFWFEARRSIQLSYAGKIWLRRWDSNPRYQAYETREDDRSSTPQYGRSGRTRTYNPFRVKEVI